MRQLLSDAESSRGGDAAGVARHTGGSPSRLLARHDGFGLRLFRDEFQQVLSGKQRDGGTVAPPVNESIAAAARYALYDGLVQGGQPRTAGQKQHAEDLPWLHLTLIRQS